jgi:hypothetical protein
MDGRAAAEVEARAGLIAFNDACQHSFGNKI